MERSQQLQVMLLMLGLVLIVNYEGVLKVEKITDPEHLEALGAQGMEMLLYHHNPALTHLKRKRNQEKKKNRQDTAFVIRNEAVLLYVLNISTFLFLAGG